MKRQVLCILLILILFTGCAMHIGAAETRLRDSDDRNPAETLLPPEPETAPTLTQAPEPPEETEPQPDPDPGLTGTVMVLPETITVTPESPTAELLVRFPETDLSCVGEEGRLCTLELKREGTVLERIEDFRLVPGAKARFSVPFAFTRYMDDEPFYLTVVLRWGSQGLLDHTKILLENYPDEVYARETGDSRPYSIDVLRNQNVVVVYGKDGDGNYTMPVQAYVCSTGRATPSGSYTLGNKMEWGYLFGGVCGQYCSRITGNILFHSVPYYTTSKDRLETEEYNKLGTAASMGCIRLPVRDAKWIFDNCPSGTPVHIYDTDTLPVDRPTAIYIDPEDPRAGWDPTDPDPENPWKDEN